MEIKIWNKENYKYVLDYFEENRDEKYLEFNKKIVSSNYPMIGVRTNDIRKIAKEIKSTDVNSFLKCKGNKYFEEILLEAFIIGYIKDLNISSYYFNKYLEKIDSWALCDMTASSMKIVKSNKDYFWKEINGYLKSDKEFIVRMGVVLLLNYYVDIKYLDKIFNIINNLKRDEYYIKMAISWLLSICYIKYKDETERYLMNAEIDKFTYNKTISKICDSYRVSSDDKERLRKTRR